MLFQHVVSYRTFDFDDEAEDINALSLFSSSHFFDKDPATGVGGGGGGRGCLGGLFFAENTKY